MSISANWSPHAPIKIWATHHAGMQTSVKGSLDFSNKVRNLDVYIKYLSFSMQTTTVKFFRVLCEPNQNISIWYSLQPGFYKHSFLLYQSMIYLEVIWLLHLEAKKHSWRISWVVRFKAPLWSQGEATDARRRWQPLVKSAGSQPCYTQDSEESKKRITYYYY